MYQDNDLDFFTQITFVDFQKRFTKRQLLGRGSGSDVQAAIDSQQQNKKIAIKKYNKQQLNYNKQDLIREYKIYNLFSNRDVDQIVGFYGAYKVIKQNGGVDYCIILQYCVNSFQNLIKDQAYQAKSQFQKLKQFQRICQCVKIFHDFNIVHRDLKPDNILIAERNGQQVLVLADFGHSKKIQTGVQNTSLRGTPKYANPNLIQENNYGLEWDIYPLGIILLQMLTGKFILKDRHNSISKFLKQIRQELKYIDQLLDNYPELNQQTKFLIKNCLTKKNYSIYQVLPHLKQIIQQISRLNISTIETSQNFTIISPQNIQNHQQLQQQKIEQQNDIFFSVISKDEQTEFTEDKNLQSPNCLLRSDKATSHIVVTQNSIINKRQNVNTKTIYKSQNNIIFQASPVKFKKSVSCISKQITRPSQKKINPLQKDDKRTQFISQLSTVRNKISQKLQNNIKYTAQLEDLKQIQIKIFNLKRIEQSKLSKQTKKQLIIYSLLYIKNSMEKINQNNKSRSKYFQRFYKQINQSLKVQFQGSNKIPSNLNQTQILQRYSNCLYNQYNTIAYRELKDLLQN